MQKSIIFPLKGNNPSNEVQKCLKPNCGSITWKTLRHETLAAKDDDEGVISFKFDSGLQVFFYKLII